MTADKQAQMDELKKALSETDITDKLVQNEINKIIESLVRVDNPLMTNLPRKPGSGEGSFINNRSANPAAAFVTDTATLTANESTYDARKDFKFKTVAVRGQVTRKAQAIGRTYTDLLAAEIGAATESAKLIAEDKIINGDKGATPAEIDGLRVLATSGNSVDAGTNGAALTLDLLDETLDLVHGDPTMIIMSRRSRRALNALLQSSQRFIDRIEVGGGFKVMAYNDVPIFVTRFISDAQTQGSSSVASDIFIIDGAKTWLEELTPMQMQRLANTSSQTEEFDVFTDFVLVQSNEKHNARLFGIIP